MKKLTSGQKAILISTDRSWRTRESLASRATEHHGWRGQISGLNQTLGSLIRLGLIERLKFGGHVHWQITDAGADYVRAWRDGS